MKPELEALYEGLCRREPDLFEPEALHKQLDAEARLCGGVYDCCPTVDQISTACRPLRRGVDETKVCRALQVVYIPFYV